jgi:putative transcription antitermination factor YqgF
MQMNSTSASSQPRRGAPSPGRILAIDYGHKRFGLAVSDELGLTARPLATMARTNRRDDLRRLRLLAREHGVRCIVVGLPLRLDGSESEMALEARSFATRVARNLGLPVELVDERLTSWEAAQPELNQNRARPKAEAVSHSRKRISAKQARHSRKVMHRDDLAAAIVLREYLAGLPQPGAAASSGGKN